MEGVFKKYLLQAFNENKETTLLDENIEHFLDYLLEHQLIDDITVRRYTIIKEFEKEYPKHNGHKTQTVYTIANKFNVSDRTVWTVLKDHQNRFDKKD